MSVTELDLSGLFCPMPIIIANRCLADLSEGDVLVVTATDPLADYDFPDYCQSAGHKLLRAERIGESVRFYLEKGDQKRA